MKTFFKTMFIMMATIIMSAPLVSCRDDSDDEPTPMPGETTTRLSQITITDDWSEDEYSLSYGSDGFLKSIEMNSSYSSEEEFMAIFKYNPLSINLNGEKILCEQSKSGYLTSTVVKNHPSEKCVLTYNKSGHLTKIRITDTDFITESVLTWDSDGLLVKVIDNWQEGDYHGSAEYEITYSQERNTSGIWPASFWYCDVIYFAPGDMDLPILFNTGLLGKAPEYLPKRIECTSDKEVSNYIITHLLNRDSYLKSETINYSLNPSYNTVITYTYL